MGWISGGLVVLLIISVALGSVMVVASDWGTSPNPVLVTWFSGGIWTIAVNGGLWLFLLLWHTYAQREVAISADRVHVRRWIEVLTGRVGRRWSLPDVTLAQFFVRGGGAKLLIETRGQQVLISIWFWSTSDALTLSEAFKRAGVPTEWSIPTS